MNKNPKSQKKANNIDRAGHPEYIELQHIHGYYLGFSIKP